ncbi:MAG: SH3-like domain-containing protein [Rubrobacter sp.]
MTASFEPGDRVRVRHSEKPGHVRTPGYLKGKTGWVESVLGEFPNPEDLAYGLSGTPGRSLYKVGFRQTDLWDDYDGPAPDLLYADVYEHWLEPGERRAE